MNKELLQIYKLYNIEAFYYLQKLKNNLKLIKEILENTKHKVKSIKYIVTLEDDIIIDVKDYIIERMLDDYNIGKITNQKNYRYLNNIEIESLSIEYIFKKPIDYLSTLYVRILDNINNNFHFVFILDPVDNKPIGIRKTNSMIATLFQFQFFARKLEDCINNRLKIMLNDHEKITLFINTNYATFPVIYFVYEARNYILHNVKNMTNDKYASEMTNYVKKKGYEVNVYRQNNQFVMGIVQ